MAQAPLISVVLPVYNGGATIGRAVESIVAQTFGDFELVIINDGSNDCTAEVLARFADPRLRILEQDNHGLAYSLNRGIQESRGTFIARMDADDESLPERFAKQVEFLRQHPEVAVVGTHVINVYPDGEERIRRRPTSHEGLLHNIVRICPFAHSSVMIRKEALLRVGGYDEEKDGATRLLVEDYDLWVRMLAVGCRFANLDQPLLRYFISPGSIFRKRSLKKRLTQQILSRREIIKMLQLPWSQNLILPGVVVASVCDHFGIKIDRVFNLLQGR